MGFTGRIVWDNTKLEGTPTQPLDTHRLNQLVWKALISPDDCLRRAVISLERSIVSTCMKLRIPHPSLALEIPRDAERLTDSLRTSHYAVDATLESNVTAWG
jgi:hypothetical protein